MKKWTLAVTLLLASCAVAQPVPSLQGSWIATAGPSRFLRGRWSAQILPDTKNAANGSWALFSESNQVVLEGTWSARKSESGWRGTWSARIQKGRPYLVPGTLRWRTSTARPLKTCSNGLRRNKLAAPGKAVVLRGIGGFSVESLSSRLPAFCIKHHRRRGICRPALLPVASITTSTSGPGLRRLENLGGAPLDARLTTRPAIG